MLRDNGFVVNSSSPLYFLTPRSCYQLASYIHGVNVKCQAIHLIARPHIISFFARLKLIVCNHRKINRAAQRLRGREAVCYFRHTERAVAIFPACLLAGALERALLFLRLPSSIDS